MEKRLKIQFEETGDNYCPDYKFTFWVEEFYNVEDEKHDQYFDEETGETLAVRSSGNIEILRDSFEVWTANAEFPVFSNGLYWIYEEMGLD